MRGISIVIGIAVTLFALAACTSQSKMMCNTWKVTDVAFDSTSEFTIQQQQMFATEIKRTITLSFRADSSYMVVTNTDTVRGKWWLDKKRQVFITDNNRMGKTESVLLKISKKNMVYTSKDAGGSPIKFSCIPAEKK